MCSGKLSGRAARALARCEDPAHALPALPGEVDAETAGWLFAALDGSGVSETVDDDVERCSVCVKPLWLGDTAFALVAERRVSVSQARMALFSERLSLFCQVMGDALRRQASAQESQRLREEMAHLDRMARLGQLSGTLAHELNQPLAATLCNAQAAARLLRQPQPDLGEVCSALDDIISSARRAGEVMCQTRALFKGEEPVYHPVDLTSLASAVLKMLRDEIAIVGAVLVRQDSAAPAVSGNLVQLQQVLINLIKNALDAVSGLPDERRRIVLSTGSDGHGSVLLSVADSGPGLKEGEEEAVFEPFYTKKADGMGMGLPICRQIVVRHGGTITARRLPEGGACFTVALPACSGA